MKDTLITGRTDLIIKNKNGEIELVDFKAQRKSRNNRNKCWIPTKTVRISS